MLSSVDCHVSSSVDQVVLVVLVVLVEQTQLGRTVTGITLHLSLSSLAPALSHQALSVISPTERTTPRTTSPLLQCHCPMLM